PAARDGLRARRLRARLRRRSARPDRRRPARSRRGRSRQPPGGAREDADLIRGAARAWTARARRGPLLAVSPAPPVFHRLSRLANPSVDPGFRPGPAVLADGLWTIERRLRIPGGLALPCRTTILRDPAERLLLISPPRLDDET